jgi:hypothetical protein
MSLETKRITHYAKIFFNKIRPKVVVEWSALLLHIREVPVKISDRRQAIPSYFMVFFTPPGKCRDSTLNQTTTASFPIYHSRINLSFDAIQSELLTVSFDKPQINKQNKILLRYLTLILTD